MKTNTDLKIDPMDPMDPMKIDPQKSSVIKNKRN